MSDIKMVNWPKRPAEQRRDELEIENAELRKLIEQMKCCTNCNSRLWAATGKGDCRECKDFDKWTPQQPEAAEMGEGL